MQDKVLDNIITVLSSSDAFYMIWLMNVDIKYGEVEKYRVQINKNRITLVIQKDWFEALGLEYRLNVIRQAVLHIVLLHWYYEEGLDKKKFLLACELEVNEYLNKFNNIIIDDSDFTVDKVNEIYGLNLERRKEFTYYYELLPECQEEPKNNGEGYGDGMDGEDKEIMKTTFKGLFEQSKGKSAGRHIDSFMERWLEQFVISPAKIRWTSIIKSRTNQFGRIIQVNCSRKKYNKYYPHNPGQKHDFVGSVLVVVDTSGSISEQEYMEFINEMAAMSKKYTVYLMHCDTAIRYYGKFSLNNLETYKIHGGGGTDFTKPIEEFNKSSHTLCIYFTDTYGECRIEPKKRVIWVTDKKKSATHLESLKNSELLFINND